MSEQTYHLTLNTNAKPVNRISYVEKRYLYRHRNKEAFLAGENFLVTYTLRNEGNAVFPGGTLIIDIHWSNGRLESSPYTIPPLNPGEIAPIDPAEWGILDVGYALFFARVALGGGRVQGSHQGGTVENQHLAPLYRDGTNSIVSNTSFFSIFAQAKEEYYQYWAMVTSAVALALIALKEVVYPSILWIISHLT
jgi:hypothetical protein